MSTHILIAAWWLGVASWGLGVVELLGGWLFWPWVFRIGFSVPGLQRPLTLQWSGLPLNRTVETASGKFRVVAPDVCLMRAKYVLRTLRRHTPFPIRARLVDRGGAVQVQARIPLFTTLFVAAWMIDWTTAAVSSHRAGDSPIKSVAFGLAGWAAAAALLFFSIRRERERVAQALTELEQASRRGSSNIA